MAGRIPQNFIDDLLARINIIDVLDGRVQKLKRTGKNYSGLCPFHKEKTPSFTANQEKQFYYCFGCGAGGNALGFLMDYENLSFPEAVEELAKIAGMEVPREDSPHQRERDLRLSKLYELLKAASDYYEQQLKEHQSRSDAVNYLKSRGLSGQAAKAFGIGFAPSGWDNIRNHLGHNSDDIKLLEESGLLIYNEDRDSHYDRFRNRIMFPIRDQRGRVIGFGGRVLGDDKPKYLNSPETPTFHKSKELYGLYEARKHSNKIDRLIIVEGYMDVVGLAQFGIHYAVATLGTATTSQHLERLFKIVPEVIFCFDGDNAGREAAMRALKTTLPVIEDGKEARFLFLPEGEDPDSLVRQEGQVAFEERISHSHPLSEFFFKCHSEGADLDSMDGRARFSTEVLPAINAMKPTLLQQMMLDKICELTHLSLEQIQTTINFHQSVQAEAPPAPAAIADHRHGSYADPGYNYDDSNYSDYSYSDNDAADTQYPTLANHSRENQKKSPSYSGPYNSYRRPVSTELRFAQKLIALLLHFPNLASEYNLPEGIELIKDSDIQLLSQLINYYAKNPDASLGQLVIDWREDTALSETIVQLYEISTSLEIKTETEGRIYLGDAFKELERKALEAQISDLQRKHELSADEKAKLLTSFQRLSALKSTHKQE
ncbi:MAG: DNA primase [Neptuniibacter caesariensis]|uniref:DNA primase n=1 Tax=Neptuniibacter caesariensis TaxID=207954 RepID=A0A2G6JQP6_NEPCE|nr:MAG: DNA primase [Neptuniibacter caesariensis]